MTILQMKCWQENFFDRKKGFAKLEENNAEGSLILGGEAAGRIDDMPTVKELIERIAEDAEGIIKKLPEKFIR